MRRRLFGLLALIVLCGNSPVFAQQRDTTVQRADTVHHGVKPGSAFLRSLIIPGWGQFSVHAYKRGTVFLALQSGSWYMLVKTLNKLNASHDTLDKRITIASDSVRAEMAKNPVLAQQLADTAKFNAHIDSIPSVNIIGGLVKSRENQRQDWITYTLFLTLADGVDAFVAAHLADFPATIEVKPQPAGGFQLQVGVPFPRRR